MLLLTGTCFAQSGDTESITVTTYYPSPAGVYKQMRLYPTDDIDPTDPCSNEGEMYYDDSDNQAYICDGTTWQSVGGGKTISDDLSLVCCNTGTGCTATCPADRYLLFCDTQEYWRLQNATGGYGGWCQAGLAGYGGRVCAGCAK